MTSIDYNAFRDEVRDFLATSYPASKHELNQRQAGMFAEPELGQWWQRTLHARGWGAPSWPVEYGGTGWDAVQKHIFMSECTAANTPSFAVQGLAMVAPVVMKFGTQAQKDFFLPGILSGELYFCQGFSEPGSGSDLASLRTAAVVDGDDYVVNGSKIWTTHAHFANWIFLLVRTSTEGKPQQGITFLLAPMSTPGISVRPIISISGEHELNQTFYDNARIPIANRIGDENKGWDVAKYLLEFERGGAYAPSAQGMLEAAKKIAAQQPGDDCATLWDDPQFQRKTAELEIDMLAQAATEHRVMTALAGGNNPGDIVASMLKLSGTALQQAASELCVEALGDYGIADQRQSLHLSSNIPPIGPDYAARPVAKYLNLRACTIYGGSSEVQHNIVARAAMGLK